MQFSADQPIVAERHMHKDSNILDFVGAAEEYETVGLRLFFPELVPGAHDWFRFLNVGEADALVNIIVRNRRGDIIRQHHHKIRPQCCWDINEGIMGNVRGTLEVQSTQPIVGGTAPPLSGWKDVCRAIWSSDYGCAAHALFS